MSSATLFLQPHAAGYGIVEVREQYGVGVLRDSSPRSDKIPTRRRPPKGKRRKAAPQQDLGMRSVALWPRSYR